MTTKATRDVIDLALRPVLNIDLRGGSINATTIGVTTAAEGHFTNLFATNFTLQGGTVTGLNAYYADIAECYRADKLYDPGTVVKIGGVYEITETVTAGDYDVFGIISSKPAFTLNFGADRPGFWLPVVMIGRAPCRVFGPVRKGDRLASSEIAGVASHNGAGLPFARSMVDDSELRVRLIEVAVVTTN